MQQPTRLISTPFAQEGDKTEIQNVTGEFDNSATYRHGFPPITMQSIRTGGKPPKGTDFNGILFDITENISFLCKGGRYQYNAGLSTLIGGYPEDSNLLLDDNVTEVVSIIAGNQNNPNVDMTGWILKPNKTTAENVTDGNQTQAEINLYGGKKYDMPVGGYPVGATVLLDNGDRVRSTVVGNTNNPNVDMTGWISALDASFVVDGDKTQKEINETRTIVKSSVFELITLNQNQIKPKAMYKTKAFYDGNNYGSAFYYWDANKSKLEANGGTIIDPANTGGFDGTYTTIESFLTAQGAGIGAGCWVCTSSKADTTRFGLHKSYDISAPLQKAIDYAKKNRGSGLVLIPEGVLTLSNKVTADIGGTTANSITIRGCGPQTQIMSNIVGDTAFEFINAFSSSIEDLILQGNGLEGLSGSGHGVAFKSTGTSEDKTNNIHLKNVVTRGFKGHDTDEYGAGIRASGVYLGRSVTCRFHSLRSIDNFAGVYLQVAEQVTFYDFVGTNCIFASVLAVECVNTLNFYNADLVGVKSTAPIEINGVSLTPASIVLVDAALDTVIMLRDTKAKGNSSVINAFNCPKVTLDGGTFLLYGTNHDAIKIASRAASWDLCIKNLHFMGQSPSTQVKVLQATSTSTGRKSKLTVKDNLFLFGGQWDYAIKVVNNSTVDRTNIYIDNNRIAAHEGATKSQLNAFLEVHNGVPRGVFTNNMFSVNDLYTKGNTIVDVVKLVSTNAQPEIESKLNVYNEYSGGTIVNRFGSSSVSGVGVYTSTTGGLIIIPVGLNANPAMVSAQLDRLSRDLRLFPDSIAAQSKDNLRFYAYNVSDGLPFVGSVNMYYEANTLP